MYEGFVTKEAGSIIIKICPTLGGLASKMNRLKAKLAPIKADDNNSIVRNGCPFCLPNEA